MQQTVVTPQGLPLITEGPGPTKSHPKAICQPRRAPSDKGLPRRRGEGGWVLREISRSLSVVFVVGWRGPSVVVVGGRGCCGDLDASWRVVTTRVRPLSPESSDSLRESSQLNGVPLISITNYRSLEKTSHMKSSKSPTKKYSLISASPIRNCRISSGIGNNNYNNNVISIPPPE